LIDKNKIDEARRRGSGLKHQGTVLSTSVVETGHVWVHGQRLHYVKFPGEGRPFLLCNGIAANLELALPLARQLSEQGVGPVVLFDLPGVGGSPSGRLVTGLNWYARLAVGLMKSLGIADQFTVAGVSWGGALAQQVAHNYPDRIRSLVLMATSPGVVMFPGHIDALVRMVTPRRYFSRRYMTNNAAIIYGGEMRQQRVLATDFAKMVRPPSTATYIQQVLSVATFSSLPWLCSIRCPVLVMGGDDDPLIRPINLRILAALTRYSTLRIIPGGGHLFMVLQPQLAASEISTFLAGMEGDVADIDPRHNSPLQ
jgi:poly(3-hydroxyalkanoate) depolymerase